MKTLAIIFSIFISINYAFAESWLTEFERSGYARTPGYDETVDFCKRLAEVSDYAEYQSFGTSPQGRDIPLLIVDKDGAFDAESVRASGKLIIMIEACIHAGESDGKDAGLLLVRDLLINKRRIDLLDKVTILFIPIINVDGHEIRRPNGGRFNQNGPEYAGWRCTAQNLNLNRDFLKADAPEMRDLLRLFDLWDPRVFIDCHTTDGADYQYPLTYGLEIWGGVDKGVSAWERDVFLPYFEEKMAEDGYPVFTYVMFRNWFDPRSGLRSGVSPPMLSQSYATMRNRIGFLIETHMLKSYKTRVFATYQALLRTMELVGDRPEELKTVLNKADEYAASAEFREKPFPIEWSREYDDSTTVEFLGIDYTIEKSELSGGEYPVYNGEPTTMNLVWFNDPKPEETALIPEAYVIPVELTDVIERLDFHGIDYTRLAAEVEIEVKSYKFENPDWSDEPYEGRFRLTAEQKEITETRVFPMGSAVVRTDQSISRIIAYLLEPQASGSLFNWGFFNTIFEQKEYAEVYVMEKRAPEYLAENPELAAEFENWKADNPDAAKNPWAVTNWFYRRTSYWDERIGKYPIGKIYDRDVLTGLPIVE